MILMQESLNLVGSGPEIKDLLRDTPEP